MHQAFLFLVLMIYNLQPSTEKLSPFIKCFWLVDSEGDQTINKEKIIPDGYPELIFHSGDPFRINIEGSWQLQGKSIIAGQIKNSFYLENTGISKMFAIKFQPWALKVLFEIKMSVITNKVIDLPQKTEKLFISIREIAISEQTFKEKVSRIESWFEEYISNQSCRLTQKEKAVDYLIQKKGLVKLKDLQGQFHISERTLERYFKSAIGLSPKFYSRIIRFSHIFQLIQKDSIDWADVVYKAGYYDQSHFIKNFKEFTGEDPSKYGFSSRNMANLFLKE